MSVREDRYPVFSRFEENVIYYSSSGLEINDDENKEADEESDHGVNALFTSGIRIKRRRGPAALCKLDVSALQAEELLSDGKYDYIKPSTDEKGNIYFIRKPYEEDGGSTSVLGCLTDILFFPVRLVGGIIGFFNFLSVIFSGKNLRKSRDNAPAKTRKKSDGRIYIEGHAINAAKELKKNSSGSEKYPGIIPSSYELCKRLVDKTINQFNEEILPLGFRADAPSYGGWNDSKKTQIKLILLVIAIIYTMCAIIFESLLKPLVIIMMIPISFIGVFLTFGLFDFRFDQGGFAAFVLLCGIVVNAGIYLITEYDECRRISSKQGLQLYLMAFNHKIVPISLTILSTILGLVPFLYDGPEEVFWFAFAMAAISGTAFSILALIIYLPIFMP